MAFSFRKIWKGLNLVPKTASTSDSKGDLEVIDSSGKLNYHNGSTLSPVLTEAHSATITNKSIDADNNPISNLETDNLKAGVLNTSTTMSGASDTQVPSALAIKTYVDNGLSAQNEASEVSFTPAGTISSTNVQAAIEELDGDIQAHINNTTDAHDASSISVVPAGTIASTNVQAAIQELDGDINTVGSDLGAHILDAVDAHDASAISNIPSGNLAATDIQGAVNELQSDIDTRATIASVALKEDSANKSNGALSSSSTTFPTSGAVKTYVDAADSTLQTNINAKVTGPASAVDNTIVRYDGTTGKLVQGSNVTIDDSDVLSGATQLNVDNIRIDGNTISRQAGTNININPGSGQYISNNGNLLTTGLIVNTPVQDSSTTGTGATVTPTAKNIVLTNASLVSISMITSSPFGQEVTLINKTGATITINDNTGATTAYRIRTGTGGNVTMTTESSLHFVYDGVSALWNLVGAPSSSSSSTVNISTKTSNYTVLSTDDVIIADGTSGAFNLTIPSATGLSGKILTLKRKDSTMANVVSIVGTIDGATDWKLYTINESYRIISDGTSWYILAHNTNTDWTAFPSVAAGTLITGTGTAPAYGNSGSPVTNAAYWRRSGANVEIRWDYRQTNSTGAVNGTGLTLFNVPSYLATASTVLVNTSTTNLNDSNSIGQLYLSTSGNQFFGAISAYSTTQFKGWYMSTGTSGAWGSSIGFASFATQAFAINMSYPVSGWKA